MARTKGLKKTTEKHVLIIGGGFAGVSCARILAKKRHKNLKITLVSNNPHFEYHAAHYRVLTGKSPLEAAIQLNSMVFGHDVNVSIDTITTIDLKEQIAHGESGSEYRYDYLVMAVGSTPNFYDTPGLEKRSYNISSVTQTLRLKRHMHDLFKQCSMQGKDDKNCSAHIMVVGGGAAGCEVAGELGIYARKIASQYGVDPSFVTIDLIHSNSRLMPNLPPSVSEQIRNRLYSLGVNIFLNRRVVKEDLKDVVLKDMKMKSRTLIWTAGVKVNDLYTSTKGLEMCEKGKVVVDKYLHAKGHTNVFIAGDGADVETSGMAEPAIRMGQYVAEVITSKLVGHKVEPFIPKKPTSIIPIGPNWAAVVKGNMVVTGRVGWWIKRLHDFKVYMTFLPFFDSIDTMRAEKDWNPSNA